jgi:hypothetical protein
MNRYGNNVRDRVHGHIYSRAISQINIRAKAQAGNQVYYWRVWHRVMGRVWNSINDRVWWSLQ